MTETPRYIRIDASDNVAIVVNPGGLPAGASFSDGLICWKRSASPQGRARRPGEGCGDRRYGQVIGYATKPIAKGRWIDETMVPLPSPPAFENLPLATATPRPLPPLEGYSFEGFRNADGSVGTKNILGITTVVQCVAGVCRSSRSSGSRTNFCRYPQCRRRRRP